MPQDTDSSMPAVVASDANLAAFQSFIEAIPEVDEGSYEGILMALANAQSIYELDAPFRSEALASFKDRPITIIGAKRASSEFAGGLGVYLVIEFVDESTGDKCMVTTGSVSIVAQVARMAVLGVFPARVVPRVASKPTKSGFYPQHLEILRDQPEKARVEDPNMKADLSDQPF